MLKEGNESLDEGQRKVVQLNLHGDRPGQLYRYTKEALLFVHVYIHHPPLNRAELVTDGLLILLPPPFFF